MSEMGDGPYGMTARQYGEQVAKQKERHDLVNERTENFRIDCPECGKSSKPKINVDVRRFSTDMTECRFSYDDIRITCETMVEIACPECGYVLYRGSHD
jgi:predicted RNA-binding Zn-ribbon protein involved in translation (DUF1610 family)